MPIPLGLWELGCPKRGDANITVTPQHQETTQYPDDSWQISHKKLAVMINEDKLHWKDISIWKLFYSGNRYSQFIWEYFQRAHEIPVVYNLVPRVRSLSRPGTEAWLTTVIWQEWYTFSTPYFYFSPLDWRRWALRNLSSHVMRVNKCLWKYSDKTWLCFFSNGAVESIKNLWITTVRKYQRARTKLVG